jgi:hypothetical protein
MSGSETKTLFRSIVALGRPLVVLAGVATALAFGAPAGGQVAGGRAGGVSGSFGDRGDAFLSFSIAGGSLALRAGTNNYYEGTWNGGPVSLSGEMTVSRAAGSVSYVTMTARVADKTWHWPPAGQDGKVEGKTVTQRYSLTYSVPRGSTGPVTGSARLDVCGGACGTYEVLFTMYVDRKTTTTATTTTTKPKPTGRPVVHAFAPRSTTPAEPLKEVTLEYSVKDPSSRATVHLYLYQGGTRVLKGSGTGAATGQRLAATVRLPGNLVGPLFFCVWAENAKGVRSIGSPKSSCAWIPFLLPKIKRVSNGCGGQGWDKLVQLENYFGNVHTYKDATLGTSYTVDFTDACDLHDAGYAGAMVKDKINGGIVDYRRWSRMQVDAKFWEDMKALCHTKAKPPIPAKAKNAMAQCEGNAFPRSIGAEKLYEFVNDYGDLFFDADLVVSGEQERANPKLRPAGGARANGPPKCNAPEPVGFVHRQLSTRC